MSLPKKIFIISSSILTILLLFWGLYYFSFKKATPVPESDYLEKNVPAPEETASTDTELKLISNDSVLSAAYSQEDNGIIKYYSKENGKAYQIDMDGNNKKTISNMELPNLINAFWSPDASKAITAFSKDGNPYFFYYDYVKKAGVPLKSNIDSIFWQNNGQILYKHYDSKSKKRTLNVSDPDGNNWSSLSEIEFRNVSAAPVPKTGLVSFWNKPDAYEETVFQTVPVVGGEKKTVFKGKFGADFLWSPNGNVLLISNTLGKANSKLQLGFTNNSGGEYRDLGIPTMVSKCVWSPDNKTVYYALPLSIPENSILPNEYDSKKFTTTDTFWKVDIATGKKTRLIELKEMSDTFDAANLFLSSEETMLFFINRKDDKLYRIKL